MPNKNRKSVLLPDYITPTNYDIYLAPDLENFTFEGEETIEINIAKQVSKITVHSAEIEIFSVVFLGKEKLTASQISYDEEGETATFTFPSKISIQKKRKTNNQICGNSQ
jgi:aminopeptidase 2